jgi:hypothetical protein
MSRYRIYRRCTLQAFMALLLRDEARLDAVFIDELLWEAAERRGWA